MRAFDAVAIDRHSAWVDAVFLNQKTRAGFAVGNETGRSLRGPTHGRRTEWNNTFVPLIPHTRARARPLPDQPANDVWSKRVRQKYVWSRPAQTAADAHESEKPLRQRCGEGVWDDARWQTNLFTNFRDWSGFIEAPDLGRGPLVFGQVTRKNQRLAFRAAEDEY